MKRTWWIVGLVLALAIAALSPLASPDPDGLERVAEDKGFVEEAREPWYQVIPDYAFPGVASESVATILAGLVGTLLMFGLMLGLGRWLRGRPPVES